MFDMYYKQYHQYLTDPEQTVNFCMDIKDADEFIRYLFTSELNEEQIVLYDEFISGFCYYDNRDRHRNIITKMPILLYMERLLPSEYFNAEIEFYKDVDFDVTSEDFDVFCKIFKKLFYALPTDTKSSIAQNITGSYYYYGTIDVVYRYTKNNHLSNTCSQTYFISTCTTKLVVNVPPTKDSVSDLLAMLAIEDNHMRN